MCENSMQLGGCLLKGEVCQNRALGPLLGLCALAQACAYLHRGTEWASRGRLVPTSHTKESHRNILCHPEDNHIHVPAMFPRPRALDPARTNLWPQPVVSAEDGHLGQFSLELRFPRTQGSLGLSWGDVSAHRCSFCLCQGLHGTRWLPLGRPQLGAH